MTLIASIVVVLIFNACFSVAANFYVLEMAIPLQNFTTVSSVDIKTGARTKVADVSQILGSNYFCDPQYVLNSRAVDKSKNIWYFITCGNTNGKTAQVVGVNLLTGAISQVPLQGGKNPFMNTELSFDHGKIYGAVFDSAYPKATYFATVDVQTGAVASAAKYKTGFSFPYSAILQGTLATAIEGIKPNAWSVRTVDMTQNRIVNDFAMSNASNIPPPVNVAFGGLPNKNLVYSFVKGKGTLGIELILLDVKQQSAKAVFSPPYPFANVLHLARITIVEAISTGGNSAQLVFMPVVEPGGNQIDVSLCTLDVTTGGAFAPSGLACSATLQNTFFYSMIYQ